MAEAIGSESAAVVHPTGRRAVGSGIRESYTHLPVRTKRIV